MKALVRNATGKAIQRKVRGWILQCYKRGEGDTKIINQSRGFRGSRDLRCHNEHPSVPTPHILRHSALQKEQRMCHLEKPLSKELLLESRSALCPLEVYLEEVSKRHPAGDDRQQKGLSNPPKDSNEPLKKFYRTPRGPSEPLFGPREGSIEP